MSSTTSSATAPTRSRCSFDPECELLSPDRKVTSHYFGRNKKETRAIPEACWVLYCRQHYQRVRYRSSDADFAHIQMGLVRSTVENLQRWDGVSDFTLSLRKRAMERIQAEDSHQLQVRRAREQGIEPPDAIPPERRCRERWLLQYTGRHVTFDDVYTFIDSVVAYCRRQQCNALEFEIVPNFKAPITTAASSSRAQPLHLQQPRVARAARALSAAAASGASSGRVMKRSRAGSAGAATASHVRQKILTTRTRPTVDAAPMAEATTTTAEGGE